MADPDRPRKTVAKPAAKPAIKVKQSTIDSMKTMGMTKAIQKANSGGASAEFIEGAKRMYGNRIKQGVQPKSSQNVQDPRKAVYPKSSQNVQDPRKSKNVQLPPKKK